MQCNKLQNASTIGVTTIINSNHRTKLFKCNICNAINQSSKSGNIQIEYPRGIGRRANILILLLVLAILILTPPRVRKILPKSPLVFGTLLLRKVGQTRHKPPNEVALLAGSACPDIILLPKSQHPNHITNHSPPKIETQLTLSLNLNLNPMLWI